MRRSNLTRLLIFICCLSCCCFGQTTPVHDGSDKTSVVSSLDPVLSEFEQRFITAAKAMPSEKYNFSPDNLHIPDAQFSGTRTFAGQVKHVAEMNLVIYSVLSGLKPTRDPDSVAKLSSKEEIVNALIESFTFGHKALATLTAQNLGELPPDSHGMTRLGIANFVLLHDADHYGQVVEYLRMNGVTPPASAK